MAATLSDTQLNEIVDAFIKAGQNPSTDLLKGLADVTGRTEDIVRQHYVARYRSPTSTHDDPYDPPLPIKS
jgi:hypothetical protein